MRNSKDKHRQSSQHAAAEFMIEGLFFFSSLQPITHIPNGQRIFKWMLEKFMVKLLDYIWNVRARVRCSKCGRPKSGNPWRALKAELLKCHHKLYQRLYEHIFARNKMPNRKWASLNIVILSMRLEIVHSAKWAGCNAFVVWSKPPHSARCVTTAEKNAFGGAVFILFFIRWARKTRS